jgi:hypothetical protein
MPKKCSNLLPLFPSTQFPILLPGTVSTGVADSVLRKSVNSKYWFKADRACFWAVLYSSQSQSYITTGSQSASLSWNQELTRDQFFPILSLIFFFYSFGFVDVGRPLWREVESVLFSFCRASPAQSFSDLSTTGLMSIAYCLYFSDSPNQEGQVAVFISPRNRVAQLYPRPLG